MDGKDNASLYSESLILSELERRFYLYLVGGDYEKLFYSIDDEAASESDQQLGLSRIRLEVEVSQQERHQQHRADCPDLEYKTMLDYILKSRINHRFENEDNLLASCQPLLDLQPILKQFGKSNQVDDELLAHIKAIPWLTAQLKRFSKDPEYQALLGLKLSKDVAPIVSKIGYSLFFWLLPRFISEILHSSIHPSLVPMVTRIRQFGRFTSGAIAKLMMVENNDAEDKWMTYVLAAINVVPLILVVNLVNCELNNMLDEQRADLSQDEQDNSTKLEVLDNYQFSSDIIRELLSLEEILKPHILENIGFEHFDPLPYLLGYAEQDNPLANTFFKAKAYAYYRLLFKTGRIHPHEAAVFLRKYKISKKTLHQLNEYDLTSVASHIKFHQELLEVEQPA